MKRWIKNEYKRRGILYKILVIPRSLYQFCENKFVSDKCKISISFYRAFGYKMDWKHPTTFSEKLQWLKLNDRQSIYTTLADKYEVRDYIKEKIGEQYLVPLIYVTSSPDELTYDILPNYPFIIKTNHGSGGVYICKDKKTFDLENVISNLKKSLKSNYYSHSREWQYKNIKPLVIVEKLLVSHDGEIPADYKLFCFNGCVEFIQVDNNRFSGHERALYDVDWNRLNYNWGSFKNGCFYPKISDIDYDKPVLLNEMIRIATILSKGFKFIRVDLYECNNQIYFGELTFHPGAGLEQFYPLLYNKIIGDKLDIS